MRIGFFHYKFGFTDGVSIEAEHWANVFESMGYEVHFFSGEFPHSSPNYHLIPGLNYKEPDIWSLTEEFFEKHPKDPKKVLKEIEAKTIKFKGEIFTQLVKNKIDMVVVENIFALPLNIPFTIALKEALQQLQIPVIVRHHDFYWERARYQKPLDKKLIETNFPPTSLEMKHVVINRPAQNDLWKQKGVYALRIPNVFGTKEEITKVDAYNKDFREQIGITKEDILFLQATRITRRKSIEHSIELVKKLADPRVILILAGDPFDEGTQYLEELQKLVKKTGIRAKFIYNQIGLSREIKNGKKMYSLWDAYVHADFVTYPSSYEGWGNQLIEAVYFKKPMLVNRYPIYKTDIQPLGFDFVEINGEITDQTVRDVKQVIADPNRRHHMVEHNFQIYQKHLSYQTLEKYLRQLLHTKATKPVPIHALHTA